MLRNPRVAALLRWLPFVVIAANLLLVLTGVVDLARAAIIVVVLEVCLLGVIVAEFAAIRIAYRRARSRGASRTQAFMAGLDACLPPSVAFVVKQELLVTLALPRLFRRESRAEGVTSVRSGGPTAAVALSMSVLALSGAVLALLFVGGPGWLRWVLFAVAVYFVLYALGLWSLYGRQGHLVSERFLRVRHGANADFAFPTSEVVSARVSRSAHRGGPVSVDEGTLTVSVFGGTNVVVDFGVPVPARFFDREEEHVTAVRFHADSPEEAVRVLVGHLERSP